MIRFACPSCNSVLTAPEKKAGRKAPCPQCGQRLQIPFPVRKKTVLGKLMPESPTSSPLPLKPPLATELRGHTQVECPACGFLFPVPEGHLGRWLECPKCEVGFTASAARGQRSSNDNNPVDSDADDAAVDYRAQKKHSALGMASFIIALLVGGLDLVLAVAITSGIARSGRDNAGTFGWKENLKEQIVAGSMAMVCLNCMSLPVCLVGVGLAVVGLIAHRNRNHIFTWIGLIGNGFVVLAQLGMYIFSAISP